MIPDENTYEFPVRSSSTMASSSVPCPVISILLVEDDESTTMIMSRLLQRIGYAVRTADCMSRALQLIDQETADILISDIGLPDGTGYQLMREVRRRGNTVGIALTGYDDQNDLDESRLAGFSAHMVKPIDFVKLQAELLRCKQG